MALGQEIPVHPWTKLATDIFHFEGVSYLLVMNYTNRFPIVHKLNSMTAQHGASHFKLIFSEYGWPNILISDSGPCYSAEVFINLMQEYSVNHITCSLHYPQSNGLAEKFVQIVKNLFYKAKEEGTDMHKRLMIYHSTPLSSSLQSLMQMLQIDPPDHNFPCQMQLEDSLAYPHNSLELRPRRTIYLHMTCA